MPTLDVTEGFDSSFFDDIIVIRRTETINQHGRSVVSEKAMSASAVVTAASPNDLARVPESQYMNQAISIITPFRLQGPAKHPITGVQTQPDEIIWPVKGGSHYVVVSINDYSGFGVGFVDVVAIEMDAIDSPPIPEPLGTA